MIKERITEIVDFATSESPYRAANKGWLTNDVFLELGKGKNDKRKITTEMANISIYWQPINEIILLLLSVILTATFLVLLSVPLAQGKINIGRVSMPNQDKINLKEINSQPEEKDINNDPSTKLNQKTNQGNSIEANEVAEVSTAPTISQNSSEQQTIVNFLHP